MMKKTRSAGAEGPEGHIANSSSFERFVNEILLFLSSLTIELGHKIFFSFVEAGPNLHVGAD